MKLQINGEEVVVSTEVKNVGDLLKHFQLHEKVVIVEHNQNILEKTTHAKVMLADGDRIEIVHFVGGG
ncbi:sulfur carrier protein ThiS [Bacillus pinisoli]|uniref:sulfur carrier protein ThiS n=1 Tax=Bacillus pinisoli TaxID=2901866 RepID=UPI001FF5B9AB|nr:sulfur carrier protein ThiS [Bacillus pinisoli]